MAVSAPEPHRIVIVGGGAAGLPLATRLGDTFGRRKRATVTLVDRVASHLWKPLLHEIAAGRMDADVHDVDYVLMAYWHCFRFRQGAVIGLDRSRRTLKLDRVVDEEGTEILPQRDVPYDTLIFCVGSVGNDYGTPNAFTGVFSPHAFAPTSGLHKDSRLRSTSSSSARAPPASSSPPKSATARGRMQAMASKTFIRNATSI
jgi:NADH dehydrogenase